MQEAVSIDSLSHVERSLLLFLETQLVDYRGKVGTAHMNDEDLAIAKRWHEAGFISFTRRPFKEIKRRGDGRIETHRVAFSDQAWQITHQLRRIRAEKHTDTLVPEETVA